jgi:hypothetical protein
MLPLQISPLGEMVAGAQKHLGSLSQMLSGEACEIGDRKFGDIYLLEHPPLSVNHAHRGRAFDRPKTFPNGAEGRRGARRQILGRRRGELHRLRRGRSAIRISRKHGGRHYKCRAHYLDSGIIQSDWEIDAPAEAGMGWAEFSLQIRRHKLSRKASNFGGGRHFRGAAGSRPAASKRPPARRASSEGWLYCIGLWCASLLQSRTCSGPLQHAHQLLQRARIEPAPHFDSPPAAQDYGERDACPGDGRRPPTGHFHRQQCIAATGRLPLPPRSVPVESAQPHSPLRAEFMPAQPARFVFCN